MSPAEQLTNYLKKRPVERKRAKLYKELGVKPCPEPQWIKPIEPPTDILLKDEE